MMSRLKHIFLHTFLLSLAIISTACTSLTDLKSTVSEGLFGREPTNPPVELESITSSYKTKLDWSVSLGRLDRFSFTPTIHKNMIYACNHAGMVYQIDASTGKILWKADLDTPLSAGVGVAEGLVLVGSTRGELIALDSKGKKLWTSLLSSELQGVPRYFDDVVIARTSDQHIYGVSAIDGRRKWVYERVAPTLLLKAYAGIVVDGGAVYAGFPGGKLVAIRADNGKLIWESTVAIPRGVTEIERIADITSLPFVEGPVVYAVAYQGKIVAIDRRTGQTVWDRDISSYAGLNVAKEKVYVSHALGSVYSLYYDSGKTFWRQGNLGYRDPTAPLNVGSIVAVGDLEGYIHLLSKDDGKFVGRTKLSGDAIIRIISGVQNNQLLALSRSGQLQALTIQ